MVLNEPQMIIIHKVYVDIKYLHIYTKIMIILQIYIKTTLVFAFIFLIAVSRKQPLKVNHNGAM